MPNRPYDAVLFDYGGVLTDGGRSGSTEAAVAEFFGIETADMADLHDEFGRGAMDVDEFIAVVNKRFAKDKQMTADDYVAINQPIYTPDQAIHDLAAVVRKAGVKTGILSNVNQLIADELVSREAYHQFYPIILSHEAGLRKPEPEIYAEALEELAMPAERVVFVDDNPTNLEPAKKLGMFTVHAFSTKQLLKAIPTVVGIEI